MEPFPIVSHKGIHYTLYYTVLLYPFTVVYVTKPDPNDMSVARNLAGSFGIKGYTIPYTTLYCYIPFGTRRTCSSLPSAPSISASLARACCSAAASSSLRVCDFPVKILISRILQPSFPCQTQHRVPAQAVSDRMYLTGRRGERANTYQRCM